MSGGGESLGAYVHPELVDCAKAVSIFTPFTVQLPFCTAFTLLVKRKGIRP